jgi:micrococcal nuclease
MGFIHIGFAFLIAAALPQTAATPRPDQHYAVRYVVDGDTIEVDGVGRVRLLGIDAPELGFGLGTAAPFAREARDRLAVLVLKRWVRLDLDEERRDGYGRALAYVFRDDGLFVNAEVLHAGYARVSARRRLRRLAELQRAEAEAQQARRGMWGERPLAPKPRTGTPTRTGGSDRRAP